MSPCILRVLLYILSAVGYSFSKLKKIFAWGNPHASFPSKSWFLFFSSHVSLEILALVQVFATPVFVLVLCSTYNVYGNDICKIRILAILILNYLYRLLPFILGPLVDMDDAYYQFLVELIHIVQLIFSPVIKKESIHYLKLAIEEHLTTFRKLFPQDL